MRIGSFVAMLAVTVQPAVAASAPRPVSPPARERRCDLGGWAGNERDVPTPIRVRAAPRADAPVLGTLPTAFPPGDGYPVAFAIVGAWNGWLKIAGADDANNGDHARSVFAGTGWIDGAAARIGIQSGRGYARPDTRSRRLVDFGGDWLTERGWIVGIADCSGKWVLVDYRLYAPKGIVERVPARPYRAWFRGACAVSETTCDMPAVDRDPEPAPGTRR